MSRTGIATLPLHTGKAPRWLFSRMTALAREIACAVIREQGRLEFLRKLSDPYWFQAFGCVLGFDWHSSGVTTTVTGALKEGMRGLEHEYGLFIAGGKGAASRRTPDEITQFGDAWSIEADPLVTASRMSAKVDSAAVQDGYQLYHHVFLFTPQREWCVIQQGMNGETRYARRYHWLSTAMDSFVIEPHAAVCCDSRGETLNLVARESGETRDIVAALSREDPEKTAAEIDRVQHLAMPMRHWIEEKDFDTKRLRKILNRSREEQPGDFEHLLGTRGVGPRTIRALSLVSELIYGKAPSFRDPARFSFAHGGKDGTPFPVDRKTYDRTVQVMKKAIESATLGNTEKMDAIRKLSRYYELS